MDIKTPNYWKGREGFTPTGIVLHITDGSLESVISHFGNPKSFVSSHYVVHDKVYTCVDEADTAWHAGIVKNPTWPGLRYQSLLGGRKIDGIELEGNNWGEQGEMYQNVESKFGGASAIINPNMCSLGIEVVSFGEFPEIAKWKRVARLVKEITGRYNIPMNNIGIANHFEVRSDKRCPGSWYNRSWITLLSNFL